MQESILQIFSTTDTAQAILTVRLSQICLTIKKLHKSSSCPRQPPGHRLFFKFKIIFKNSKSYYGKVLTKAYVMIYFSIIKNFSRLKTPYVYVSSTERQPQFWRCDFPSFSRNSFELFNINI
jgi:hypothetical protein